MVMAAVLAGISVLPWLRELLKKVLHSKQCFLFLSVDDECFFPHLHQNSDLCDVPLCCHGNQINSQKVICYVVACLSMMSEL